MPDPFAAALKCLFNAPGSAAAVYIAPNLPPQPIRVIWNQGSQAGTGRFDNRMADVNTFDIQRRDVLTPARGATIAVPDPVTGEQLTFKLNGAPVLDVEGVCWSCPAQPA